MKVLRIGLSVAVAFAVLAFGTVEPWSEAILVGLAAVLLLYWCGWAALNPQVEIAFSPLLIPLAVLSLLALVQWLVPLSAYPYATRIEFLKLAAGAIFFFLAVQCFRNASEARGFIWFLLLFGFAVALFGILQHLTYNGKLYWLRELRESTYPFGPFVNRNHFAGLMELIAPLGLALLLCRGVPRDQAPLVGLFAVLPVGALFLSASRGGIASFLLQLFLLMLLSWARAGGRRTLLLSLVVLLFVSAFVFWLGVVPAWERFQQTQAGEITQGRRMIMLGDSWRMFLDHPWLGAGLGSFEAAYPRYESFYDGKIVSHAHNDYVELLAEAGLVGAVCGLAFLFLLYRSALAKIVSASATQRRWNSESLFSSGVRLGSLVACSGLLLHGLVDFNFHIPSNALLFLLSAHLASYPSRQAPVIPLETRAL